MDLSCPSARAGRRVPFAKLSVELYAEASEKIAAHVFVGDVFRVAEGIMGRNPKDEPVKLHLEPSRIHGIASQRAMSVHQPAFILDYRVRAG